MRQERFEEAESILLPACEGLSKIQSPNSAYTQQCFKHVIELYEKTDRLTEAKLYQEKLQNIGAD